MAYFVLDSRCRQILDYLAAQNEYKNYDDIADALSTNRNSVKYTLSKINGLLSEHGLDFLEKKHGFGIRMTCEQKLWWADFSCDNGALEYVLTQDERIAAIICLLIISGEKFSVDTTAGVLKVSRNTIFADLRNMRELLTRFGIEISYDSRMGYMLSGGEFALRSLMLHQFSALTSLIEQNVLELFEREAYLHHREKLQTLQEALKVEYGSGVIDRLTMLMLYVHGGKAKEPIFSEGQIKEVTLSREFAAVSQHYYDLSETEKIYLACQLLGNRAIKHLSGIEIEDMQNHFFAKDLVMCFERLTGISVENREGLTYELSSHVSQAEFRNKYGMIFQEQVNPALQQQHPELVAVIRIIINEFYQDMEYLATDEDISFMTSCFYKHLRQMPFVFEYLPAILVVDVLPDNGDHLARAIMSDFPMLQIHDVLTVGEFYNLQDNRSLVISTLPLNTESQYALIDGEMNKTDHDTLVRCYIKYRFGRSLDEIDDLMRRLRPHIHKDSLLKVKAELVSFLFGKTYSLRDILLPAYVQTGLEPDNWESAIRQAGAPIVERNAVNGEYIDSIINSISMYGSYSFITDGVYLAHAEINGNVRELSVGVSTLTQQVLFPDGKPVRILLVMCPIDKHSHFEAFKEIVRVFGKKDAVDAMLKAGSPDELFNIITDNIR